MDLRHLPSNFLVQCKACRDRRRPSRIHGSCEVCRKKLCPDCVQVHKKAVLMNCNKSLSQPSLTTLESAPSGGSSIHVVKASQSKSVDTQAYADQPEQSTSNDEAKQNMETVNHIKPNLRHGEDDGKGDTQVKRPSDGTGNNWTLGDCSTPIALPDRRHSRNVTPYSTCDGKETCCHHFEPISLDAIHFISRRQSCKNCCHAFSSTDIPAVEHKCQPITCHKCHSCNSAGKIKSGCEAQTHKKHKPDLSPIPSVLEVPVQVNSLGNSSPRPEKSREEVKTKQKHDENAIFIKSENDKHDCDISGMALLSENELLLADKDNKKLKLLDLTTRQLTLEVVLKDSLRSVCVVPDRRVGLTLPDKNLIKLLAIRETGVVEDRDILCEGCDGYCYGLAYCNGSFVVSFVDPAAIQIIKLSGDVLLTFKNNNGSNFFFYRPQYLSVTKDEKVIYISDTSGNAVIKADANGSLLDVHTFETNWYPLSVQAVSENEFLVCSSNRSTISKVSRNSNNNNQKVVKDKKIEPRPKILCYCPVKNRTYVTSSNYDKSGFQCNYLTISLDL